MSTINSAIENVIQAKSAAVDQQIQFALAAKALQATKAQGDAAVRLLESASLISQSKAHGKGVHFDASA